jgi:hypothetical protein
MDQLSGAAGRPIISRGGRVHKSRFSNDTRTGEVEKGLAAADPFAPVTAGC